MESFGDYVAVATAVVLMIILFLATSLATLSDKDSFESGERGKGPSVWTVGFFIATIVVPLGPPLLAELPVLDNLTRLGIGSLVLLVLLMVVRRFVSSPMLKWTSQHPNFGEY